ncbi:adenylylsulfate kinase [Xenorhabdus szentirmaii]|nr:adenylylsulfate kinase [Xenorhabdus szentirmaii]
MSEIKASVSPDIVWHSHVLGKAQREAANGHPALVIWFTGLSGSGKSTLAGALEQALFSRGSKRIYWMAITCVMACAVI